LRILRRAWDDIETEATHRLRSMTIADSLRTFALLYEAYAPRLRAEEADYLIEREAALIERQRRLLRLAEWLKAHPDESRTLLL
jgi:hypothetical protein